MPRTMMKRTEQANRTFKIYLNRVLYRDSDGVNYNVCGTVIDKEFVKSVYTESGLPVLELVPGTFFTPELVPTTRKECVSIFHEKANGLTIPADLIEKIEISESKIFTFTP